MEAWYTKLYCHYCGSRLQRLEQSSTIKFNEWTGIPWWFIHLWCPKHSDSTLSTYQKANHYNFSGAIERANDGSLQS